MNDSSTGGYLAPAGAPAPVPLQDQSFEDFLQEIFVGITGMPGTSVFPRWQPEPPTLPDVGTDWAAIGITDTIPDTYAVEIHDPINNVSEFQRHEIVNMLASFYGPNAGANAGLLRDGLQIAQNREVLTNNGMGLVDTGEPRSAPTYVKDKWLKKVDMRWTIRRAVFRTYPVLNLLSAKGALYTDVGITASISTP